MAFAETDLGILQAVVFFRHRADSLGEKRKLGYFNGFFACFGNEYVPGYGYKIPYGNMLFKERIGFVAQVVFGNVELHTARKIAQVRKGRFAH